KASELGSVFDVDKALDSGVGVDATDAEGRTALMLAVQGESVNVLRHLFDKGAAINARDKSGATALMYAARHGQTPGAQVAIKMLLDRGADVNATDNQGRTALAIAREQGHDTIVELLRAAGGH
ncbi:MAG: ankyrin repeat domain-containing protein, partial [Ottowia sp.]|nr:ankyrin repeat domain-containing protein [Ottowia sp.]